MNFKFALGSLLFSSLSTHVLAQVSFVGSNRYSTTPDLKTTGKMDAVIDLTGMFDTDLYINGASLQAGSSLQSAGFVPNIAANFSKWDRFGNFAGSLNFTPGMKLDRGFRYSAGGTNGGLVSFRNASAWPVGNFSSVVTLLGGSSPTDQNVIGNSSVQLDVVSSFGLNVNYINPVLNITPNAPYQTIFQRVENLGSRDLKFLGVQWSFTSPRPPQLYIGTGDTGFTLGAGQSVDREFVSAESTGPFSQFTAKGSIFGGYYSDDFNQFVLPGQFVINSVPEPTSMIAMGLGVAGLLRRKAKKKA